MRILYCNKYDYPFSGTESCLFELMDRVEKSGHETALFSMDHGQSGAFAGRKYRIPYLNFKDANASLRQKLRMAAHALYSPSARTSMRECLKDFAPDVAHIRGIYHHLSPSILWELRRQRVPVVYHVNDFKMLCPTYNFVAHGHACEACEHGAFYHAVTMGCYKGSKASATVLAAEAYLHRWLRSYGRCVDLFLAPSQFVRNKLICSGFPANKIEVLPHFQVCPEKEDLAADEGYVLYFGRLSAEKGVYDLLRAMVRLPQITLVIAGDGPERQKLEALARELNLDRVLFAGMVHGDELQKLIAGCSFSVFPSHAYETLGKSILESYAWGRPVIASDLGSRREMVSHGVTGLLYHDCDREQLAHSIAFLFDRPDLIAKMGAVARERIRTQHDPQQYLEKLLNLYGALQLNTLPHASTSTFRFSRLFKAPAAKAVAHAPVQRSIRVAFIGGRGLVSKYSGVESYYEQAGKELVRLGHDVTVYCRSYFTPPLATHMGMRVKRLPTIRSKHLETLVHTILSTLHAMVSDFDIVHYHCLGPSIFSFMPRLVGKKTVVTVQGLDWQREKWGRAAARILRFAEFASIKAPSATMVVSRTLEDHYRKNYQHDTIYAPNGATSPSHKPTADVSKWSLLSDSYVLFLGRFSPEKNCELLVKAFIALTESGNFPPEMKLVLAGGSSHSDAYADRLRSYGSERIRILPWVSGNDLHNLLSNAATFVLPSSIEGLSLALLDAMAAGVCVLTSDIPENREVVDGAGFTFRSGNQKDLERKLDFLAKNPAIRRQFGERGRERIVSQYQWPDIARSIEKTYLQVLGWNPKPTQALKYRGQLIQIRTVSPNSKPLEFVTSVTSRPKAPAPETTIHHL